MATPDDKWGKVMDGIQSGKRFSVPGVTIYQNGEIKLFGLFTVRKKKEKNSEKDFNNPDDYIGI